MSASSAKRLNHPHICTLFDVGENYLAMEFIDGQPVKGPLAVAEVVRLGAQIADALDAAHRKGITHRDLKPGNGLVTKGGVKVIDFGLAKAGPIVRGETDVTLTKPLTSEGTLLGTVPYMSPEQLQGHEAGARSDIFALGCVLYEMLTGKRAFEGKSQVSIMAAILEHEPAPLTEPVVPARLDRIIRRCLRKNPDDRWQSARDIAIELHEPPQPEPVATPAAHSPARLSWMIAVACALAAAATCLLALRSRATGSFAGGAARAEISPPPDRNFSDVGDLATSPDGRTLAFVAKGKPGTADAPRKLVELVVSPGNRNYAVSPDGRRILAVTSMDGGPTPVEVILNWPALAPAEAR